MESVSLDPAGLEWLAGTCTGLAGELTGNASAPTVGLPCQATSAAVGIAHADVAATRAMLSSRMVSTSAKLAAAASGYVAQDGDSAAEIAAVGATVEA